MRPGSLFPARRSLHYCIIALLHYCNTTLVRIWHGAHPIDCTPAYNRPLHWLQSASEFQWLPQAVLPTAPSLMEAQFPKHRTNEFNSEEVWRKALRRCQILWIRKHFNCENCRRVQNKQMHRPGRYLQGCRWQKAHKLISDRGDLNLAQNRLH